MPLNSSGPISIGGSTAGQSINLELGRSATAQSNLNESALRTLAGVASGSISLSNFYGKANVAFTPDGGTSAGSPVYLSDLKIFSDQASVTIECNQSATWTWTRAGSFGTASVASGSASPSISFVMSSSSTNFRSTVFTVSATAGGITRYWSVQLQTEPNL
jgi:hypothetical protein